MFKKLFDSNDKQIKKYFEAVERINSFEKEFESYSKEKIQEQTNKWQEDLAGKNDLERFRYLEEILPKAFALVREASKRTIGLRHFDVQMLSGIALHEGKITEQKTGEGKTLTATCPIYLNALTGQGVHLVTPNDYLSRHGAGWMGPVYDYLGLKVGVIMQERSFIFDPAYENNEFEDAYATHLKEVPRQETYKSDVVYGTNHEFGFDYLRDNMVRHVQEMVQTNPNGDWGYHSFAIVDEVDSILIDVARTPLIISAPDTRPSERYIDANRILQSLIKDTDYEVDEKYRNVVLTDLGIRRVERLLGIENLYEQDFEMVHLIEQALIANTLYEKDKDYVVKNDAVVIVDQFTGRLLPSNRFSNGLHQAIEAKEKVTIQEESKTLAEISYQNYFRMYKKLAGMTGTAATEAEEFYKIYNLEVIVAPTNKPTVRQDLNDVVYKTTSAKFKAAADEIEEHYKKGQPILVGTTSVEKSQLLHNYLTRKKIPHEILNAKNHEKEAMIIAQAGRVGAVTISTNMAGRGVDIILGGDPVDPEEQARVKELGGLYVIGTERHESRRIDNQLRGRSGRQGDPGKSRFFVSLQDDLMRIFGGERIQGIMDRFGLDENVPLESSIVTKSIENAQKKVEGFNFDRRKQLVDMDDIMNTHREVIYQLRRKILNVSESGENSDWLIKQLEDNYNFDPKIWDEKIREFGENNWHQVVPALSLPVVDLLWMDHLVSMDQVREGIGLRGYAQKDPMVEYKKEAHERFEILVQKIYQLVSERISKVTTRVSTQENFQKPKKQLAYEHGEIETGVSEEGMEIASAKEANVVDRQGRSLKVTEIKSGETKVGRNDPCPCGSGKKFKNCCGKNQ